MPTGSFGFTLGDVAGKGPSAALLTAMIQGAFAAQVTSTDSPAALMAHINRTLIRRAIQSRFVTVMYGVLAPDGRLTYSNAGHNPPILVGRSGVRRLETGGLILGLFPHATYEEETLQLEDGDTLVVFSDGVTEALNAAGDEFGEERLLPCIRRTSRQPDRRAARQDSGDGQDVRGERGPERRRDRARAAVRQTEALVELLQRVLLGVERVEDGQQLGDGQQIVQALGEVHELHAAAGFRHRRVGADELAEAGAVDVRDVGQVDEDVLVPLVHEAVDLVLELLIALR